ncbi:DUF7151 family protein [Pyxidicoccus xibeiensis]|uniref:DUF7151 family protein n=1 Tax=Pyxidicoccus xibeiensis TaxID=2906759 RepID=UPI0020A78463|nr:hypothetical protein [Pyxidicoccus xibeiensis]MCP3139535.1 hypothetical protein [Pyxidicoccus xibeiensis]
MRWTWLAVLALVAGCDGIKLEDLVRQHEALTRIVPEPPGERCPHGGQAVLSGLDGDDDGVLGSAEVTDTTYVCTTSLMHQQPEPAGLNCEHGGHAVRTGLDLDADGQLDDEEVRRTEYICATATPDVLVRTQQVPPGERCPHGGHVSHAGRDLDGDGLLEDGEITREVYGCTEPEPVLAQVRPLTEPPFVCAMESTLVEAGVDMDRDGVLDREELRTSVRLCVLPSRARVRQRPEPEGARCPRGGAGVELGQDSNEDGTLEDSEVQDTLYVCYETAAYEGDYEVRSAADLAALRAVSHIRGALKIIWGSVTEVVLPGLTFVEGDLDINHNPALTRVELPGLRYVGGGLHVADSEGLVTLVIGPPGPEPEWPVKVGMDLHVGGNPQLTTLAGLTAVAPRRGLHIGHNAALVDAPRFPYVEALAGSVSIQANPLLRELPLSSLASVGGSVEVIDNDALTSIEDLRHLENVGGDYVLRGNDTLETTFGWWLLRTVGGVLEVSDNDSLEAIGSSSLRSVGALTLHGNASLETVSSNSLNEVVGHVSITSNPKLLGVAELPVLQSVGGGLTLSDNALLADLSGFDQIPMLEHLRVVRNGALTGLGALRTLRELRELTVRHNPELTRLELARLAHVSTRFEVTGNPKLPTCLAVSLAEDVYAGTAEARVIQGNADSPCAQ